MGGADAAQLRCGGDRLPEERTVTAAGADAGAEPADGNGGASLAATLLLGELIIEGGRDGARELNAIARIAVHRQVL